MTTYRTTFEAEIDVRFLEPEKTASFFLKGSEWSKSFYSFDDLEDLARSIAHNFQGEPQRWSSDHQAFHVWMEGYGVFIKQDDGWFVNTEAFQDGGRILIREEAELEPTFTELREEQAA